MEDLYIFTLVVFLGKYLNSLLHDISLNGEHKLPWMKFLIKFCNYTQEKHHQIFCVNAISVDFCAIDPRVAIAEIGSSDRRGIE